MDSDEEAGTAASPDHVNARLQALQALRLQTRCAMLLIHLWLSTCAAVLSTAWLEIPPVQRTG